MDVVGGDVKAAMGNVQGWCEAAKHAMRKCVAEPNCEAPLTVDVANAFNNTKRKTTRHKHPS